MNSTSCGLNMTPPAALLLVKQTPPHSRELVAIRGLLCERFVLDFMDLTFIAYIHEFLLLHCELSCDSK